VVFEQKQNPGVQKQNRYIWVGMDMIDTLGVWGGEYLVQVAAIACLHTPEEDLVSKHLDQWNSRVKKAVAFPWYFLQRCAMFE
jgi:hypothetical protein